MMINPCTVIGLLISLVALVFVSLEASVKKFVEVFIPFKPEANSTEFEFSCSIAGLGVYITEYDSSCLSAELLAASRVPAEKFTAPTTTFKLLFPAQENFVAEVLPVNAEILDELDKAFGGGVTQLLGPDVTAIQDTTFKNCEQYMGEIETKMLALFSTLNDKLLNQVVPQIVGEVAAALSNPAVNTTQPGAILSIGPALSKGPAENPLNALMAFTYFALLPQGLAGFCSLVPDDILTVLDAGQLQCISNIYAGAAAKITSEDASEAGKDTASLLQVLSGQATGLSSLASVLNITLLTVAGSVGATFSEGGIFEEVTVTGIPGQQTPLCLVWSGCKDLTLTKAQLVQKVFAVLTFLQESTPQDGPAPEFDNPFAEAVFNQLSAVPTGFGAYALSLVFIGAPLFTGTNATDVELANAIGAFSIEATPPPFPDTFSGTYIPCALLQFVETAVLSIDLEGVPNFPETCDFAAFWPAAAAVAGATQNSLAPVLESLALLYGACNSFQLTPGNCDLLFPSLFINGAYGSELDLTAFAGDQHAVFTQAIAACDDDETDKEKIGGAQVLLSLAIVLYALTPLSGGASLAMNRNQHIVLILTGFLSILAFALNMGALLLVSSAPVYEDVGGDPTEFTPVYREGIVVTFGKVAMGLGAGAGACFFVAACVSCKAVGKAEEVKEMVPVEDAVAPPKVDVDDVKQTV